MKRSVLASLLLALAVLADPAGPPQAEFQVEDMGLSLEQMADKLQALVNEERGRQGLPALAFDPRLRAVAREHCGQMIAAGRLGHDFAGYPGLERRAASAGLYFSQVGENVARSITFVLRFFHEALMASPSHRENILDRQFTHLGVGIAKSGDTYYATQEFARLYEPLPPVEMEAEMDMRIAVRFKNRTMLDSGDYEKVRGYCRLASLAFLNGVIPANPPDDFGSALIITLGFTEIETGLHGLLYKLRGQLPLSWCQGVSFTRNGAYPGGAYGMTLVLFPDLRQGLLRDETPEGIVMSALQRLHPFTRTVDMDRAAKKATAAYHLSPATAHMPLDSQRRIAVYKTASLDTLPDGLSDWIGPRRSLRRVGVNVLYPLAQGQLGNNFIVAIVGR